MQMQKDHECSFFLKHNPKLFLYFWGVLDTENTVRLLKKSKRSILFDADAICKAVTAHAQISGKFLFTKMTNDE